ncbi:MAG: hypothetical protein AB7J32_26000 [Pseudonocardia sp.]
MVARPATVSGVLDVPRVVGGSARTAVGFAAVVIVAAVVAGPFPDWLSPHPDAGEIIVHAAIGAVFVAVGLLAWHRRPCTATTSSTGPWAGCWVCWASPSPRRCSRSSSGTGGRPRRPVGARSPRCCVSRSRSDWR